jgi:hypothetical protein
MVGGRISCLKVGFSPRIAPVPSRGYKPEIRVTLLSVKDSSRLNNLRPHCPQNVVSSVVSALQKGHVFIRCHTPFQRLRVLKIVCVCCEALHHSHADTVYQNLDYKLASGIDITSADSLFIRRAYELFSHRFLRVRADFSGNSLSGCDSTNPFRLELLSESFLPT